MLKVENVNLVVVGLAILSCFLVSRSVNSVRLGSLFDTSQSLI